MSFSQRAAVRRFLRHGTMPQLAAFDAVMRLGHVTRAADALCCAQPTLSGHLRKLGDALDVRLFDLSGGRLVPTAAAYELHEATREVLGCFERCEQALARWRIGVEPRPARPTTRAAPPPP